MTLEQLRIFIEVATSLNMTRAGETLNLTQPAVSAAIAALETRHDIHLFDRIGRRLELTATGRALLPEARALLARAADATQMLADLAGLHQGEIRIAASQTVATYWLPPHMARFAAAYPGITLTLQVANTAQVLEVTEQGGVDIGCVEGTVAGALWEKRAIGGDRLGLYAAPDHPLIGKRLTAAALRQAQWVAREQGSGTRDHWIQDMAAHGLDATALTIGLELPSNGAVLEAVEASEMIAAISDLAAAPRLKAGLIARLDWPMPHRSFTMIRMRERHMSHALRAFIAHIE